MNVTITINGKTVTDDLDAIIDMLNTTSKTATPKPKTATPKPKPKNTTPKPKTATAKQPKSGKYEPGTVFVDSWGYNMTIIDFYEVVRSTDKTVWLRQIKQHTVEDTGFMSGTCAPNEPHEPCNDKVTMCRINKRDPEWVGSGYHMARLWDGKPRYFNHMD